MLVITRFRRQLLLKLVEVELVGAPFTLGRQEGVEIIQDCGVFSDPFRPVEISSHADLEPGIGDFP